MDDHPRPLALISNELVERATWDLHVEFERRLAVALQAITTNEPGAIDEALAFLEADPYHFRSGYARNRVARRLARTTLDDIQRGRARSIVLSVVDGRRHVHLDATGRLAHSVADNSLRRELRQRLHRADSARRALRVLVRVRHPGLRPDDLAAARALVLTDAGAGQGLSPTVVEVARHLWSAEWRAELEALLPEHHPGRAGAKRLLAAIGKDGRPGP